MSTPVLPRPPPNVAGWETTLRCNMRCRHCGSTAGPARDQELTTAEGLHLCRQLAEMGVPRVVLTGGETLMRPDWPVLVDHLLGAGVEVGLLTNGWTLTRPVVKQLAAYRGGSFYVSVSLDGVPAVHDEIRARRGSFSRAFRGAQALQEQGVPVGVITTMNRANAESLPELRRMLLQDLQPYCWQVQVTTPFGRAREDAGCTVGPVEYTRFACFVTETRRLAAATRTVIYAGDCLGYLSSMEEALRGWTWTGCGAGLQVMGIQSNGNVKGCLSIVDDRFVEGSIRQAPVREIWERPGAFAYTRDFDASQLHGTCAGCPVGAACRGGCTASSVSVNGRPHDAPYCLRAYEAVVAQPQDVKKTPKTRTTTSRAAARAHT